MTTATLPSDGIYSTIAPWPGQDDGDRGRKQRGLAIAAKVPIKRVSRGYLVPSQSSKANYLVSVDGDGNFCSCRDFESRQLDCKHIYAVLFKLAREAAGEDAAPDIEAVQDTKPERPVRDWSAYNAAKKAQTPTFHRMLAHLCSGIPRPEKRGRGKPPMHLSDMAFAVVDKVYRKISSRVFDGDLADSLEEGWIERKPAFNTVSTYMSSPALTPVLHDLISTTSLPLVGAESHFAIDSTGFSPSQTVNWRRKNHEGVADNKGWVKGHFVCGVKTKIVTAVEVSDWRSHDNNYFKPLLRETAENHEVQYISADKAYLDRQNFSVAWDELGAIALIPFKTSTVPPPDDGSVWTSMWRFFTHEREQFLELYHQRSNVETGVYMVKNNHQETILSKSPVGQENEVLCKFICHNLCVLVKAMHTMGIPEPFADGL